MFVRQIRETVSQYIGQLLTEDKATDNRSKGRKLAKSYVAFDRPGGEQEMEIWKKLPVVRKDDYSLAPYLYPLYFRDKPNDEQCSKINSFLLNSDLSVEELSTKYDTLTKLMDLVDSGEKSEEKEETKNTTDSEYKYNGYKIVRINDFNDAKKYAHYVDWCVTQSPSHFKSYTKKYRIFYFCLERGFENVKYNAYEYDESMMAVLVNRDGSIHDVVSRSNNEGYIDGDELFEILGYNAKSVLKPISEEEIKSNYGDIKIRLFELLRWYRFKEAQELCDYNFEEFDGLCYFNYEDEFFGFYDTYKSEVIKELDGYKSMELYAYSSMPYIRARKGNKYNLIDREKKSLIFGEDKEEIKRLHIDLFFVRDNEGKRYLYNPFKNKVIEEDGLESASRLGNNHIVMDLINKDRVIYSLGKGKIIYNLGDKNLRETYVNSILGVGEFDYIDLETDREFTLKNGVDGYEIEKIERDYADYLGTNMCLCRTTDKKRIFVNDKVEIVGRPFKQVISFEGVKKNPLVTDGKEDFYIFEQR